MKRRQISPLALLLTSVSAILGSGWLFSSYYTATLAGPSAILAWVMGGFFMIIVAFAFAEICGMIPITGSSARIPQLTHGPVVSFMFSWMVWLSYLALMATEVQAVIQYSDYYFHGLTRHGGGLSHSGYMVAAGLMFILSVINVYSIRWLIRANSILTLFKIIIPIFVITIIFAKVFNIHHVLHPVHSTFFAYGSTGVMHALTLGGIVFAFNGFKQAAELAGEAKCPKFSVPFAIVGSVACCLVIFLFLQAAFFTSLDTHNLIHGWAHLVLSNNDSPLSSILEQDHLNQWLPVLYAGAVIAPLAAGLMYCTSAARSLYGMSKNGYIPSFVQKLTPSGNPHYAIMINFAVGMCFFAPLPGWNNMVAFLTSLLAITYAAGPACLVALRRQAPNRERPIRLPLGSLWSYAAFVICTLLTYWSGWPIIQKFAVAIGVGFVIVALFKVFNPRMNLNWRASIWMWPYFIGIIVISYIGDFGGHALVSPTGILIIIAIFCAIILWMSALFRRDDAEANLAIKQAIDEYEKH